MIDDLSEILATFRIKTTLFAIADLPTDWAVSFPATSGAYFHVIGGCDGWLHIDGASPQHVASGDTVLLSHGSAHRLTCTVDAPTLVAFDPVLWKPNQVNPVQGRDSRPTGLSLVCGAVEAHNVAKQPLLSSLPVVFSANGDDAGAEELQLTLRLLSLETCANRSGSQAVLARIGGVLLVQLIRLWLEQPGITRLGRLAAMRDPQLGSVIAAMEANLAHGWTIDSLAEHARLSRSRFAERFTELVGRSPMSYLTAMRLQHADELLRDGHTIREASRAVGYQSQAAFSRAFTRQHGLPPSKATSTP
jgi:AraC-like DNA-binding protein